MKFSPFMRPTCLGLDIQPEALRFVQLVKKKRQWHLERAFTQPLAAELFSEGMIKQWDSLSIQLAELVKEQQLNGMPVAIALPEKVVKRHRITLPSGLSEVEMEAEIEAYVHKELPGMRQALCVDFALMPAVVEGYVDVQFVAVRQAYLSQYVACINAAGLKVKVADVDKDAYWRALRFAEGHICRQAMCCIHDDRDAAMIEPLPNPFTNMIHAQQIDADAMTTHYGSFILACGLAMREVPVWLR